MTESTSPLVSRDNPLRVPRVSNPGTRAHLPLHIPDRLFTVSRTTRILYKSARLRMIHGAPFGLVADELIVMPVPSGEPGSRPPHQGSHTRWERRASGGDYWRALS